MVSFASYMHISLNIKYLRKLPFIELIIAHSFCNINVLLQKLLKLYPGNAFLKRNAQI